MWRVGRHLFCIAMAAGALLIPVNPAFGQPHSQSSASCTGATNRCPLFLGQARSGTTQRQVSRFLMALFEANEVGALPMGIYGLHYCSNPGPPPYKVTCFLWPSAPKGDLVKLEVAFRTSKLFRTLTLRIPTP